MTESVSNMPIMHARDRKWPDVKLGPAAEMKLVRTVMTAMGDIAEGFEQIRRFASTINGIAF